MHYNASKEAIRLSHTAKAQQARRRRPLRTLFAFLLVGVMIAVGVTWIVVQAIPSFEADLAQTPVTATSTYLLIGSDSRENLGDFEGEFGYFAGQRADVIMVAS